MWGSFFKPYEPLEKQVCSVALSSSVALSCVVCLSLDASILVAANMLLPSSKTVGGGGALFKPQTCSSCSSSILCNIDT